MGSLLLLKFPFGADDPLNGVNRARQTPILVEAELTSEVIQLRLPAGFTVDELPQPAMFEESFGKYSLSYAAINGSIVAHRTFELRGQTVNAAQQTQLVAFFSRVRTADASPVVLKRQ